jgi:hypothetical protein
MLELLAAPSWRLALSRSWPGTSGVMGALLLCLELGVIGRSPMRVAAFDG